jgi:carboxyl-terminal processing protease
VGLGPHDRDGRVARVLAPRAAFGHTLGVDPRGARSPKLSRGAAWFGLGLVAVSLLVFEVRRSRAPLDTEAAPAPAASVVATPVPSTEAGARAMALPSGAPTRLSCDEAQRVTAFLQRELAAPPIAPTPSELAELWGGMLDPHGLWSAAPDSPLPSELVAAAPEMLASLFEQAPGCAGAERVARVWEPWQKSLLAIYDQAFDAARARAPLAKDEVFRLAAEPIFEDDPVTRPAVELARELGQRLGAFAARFPEELPLVEQARARFFPTGLETLRDIATLSALRAYVPLVDPHGDFAPLDEEWALYAGDDTLDGGSPLWGDVTRTPLGARVTDGPASPLQLDDLVLSINDLTLAGASIDQIEQAARSQGEHGVMDVRVLRQGEPKLLSLHVADQPADENQELDVERIRYGRDDQIVLRVVIPDVGDALGQDLADVLARETPGTSAVLLDLRGNGGGSLDAAVESLSLLLPGAKLFPLIHRGAVTEVLEAQRPEHTYAGPVAALVDGDTASAAEMLAGAIQAYGRGSLIGARTFGKGCVQEYFDDVVASGVLRMTTLQFVMPNGQPLQQIGLSPDLTLPLTPALERESQITRQPITFDGPDVRDTKLAVGPAWPRASSTPGPCEDPLVCVALARLSGVRPALGAGRGQNQSEGTARAARSRAGTR